MDRKKAVVTGAGGGIGRVVCERLCGLGMEVVAVDLREEYLAETVAAVEGAAGVIHGVAADVTDLGSLRSALEPFGRIHSIVANAGICRQARLDEVGADDTWRAVMSVNVDGVWNTMRVLGPALEEGGRVVAVSSGLGKLGRSGYSAYAASKHAVLGIVKCLSKELAPRRINVNAVCPGWVDTEMAREDISRTALLLGVGEEKIEADALAGIPLGRFVQAAEVASMIVWLLGEESAAVTGQALNISCGEFFA